MQQIKDLLYILSKDSEISVVNLNTLKLEVSCKIFEKEDEISLAWITPEGYFKANKSDIRKFHFIKDGRALPLIDYEMFLNRPDIIMKRLGFASPKFYDLYKKIVDSNLTLIGICTHFPMADTDETETKKSIELFEKTISDIDSTNMLLHVDNSASTLYKLDNSFNMARVGIAAYGVQITAVENENELIPTMEIKTRISNLQVRKKGEAVSYGKAQRLSRDSIIATAPIGYGDGYPWNSFPDGKVIVNNQYCNLIGRVTMDQILFDVTDVNVQIDDEVTVLGSSVDGKLNISVSDIAQWNKTIEWEILTNMSKRLERVEVE